MLISRAPDAALVGMGGALGTLTRYTVAAVVPTPPGGVPAATLLVNVVGAFLLGLLLGRPRPRRARLAWGTGFLGGLTTYSTLAVETDLLIRGQRPLVAAAYLVISVGGGAAAAVGGLSRAAR